MAEQIEIKTWIELAGVIYPTDTMEQIEEAQAAMREHGVSEIAVYVGEPGTIDAHLGSAVLIAE